MIKILGQIDLEQFKPKEKKKSPEFFHDKLMSKVQELVSRVNEKHGDILDADARIKVTDDDDLKIIKMKETAWANERGFDLDQFNNQQERSKGTLAEMSITLILDKYLGDRFISVRSSKWDDYENGIDNFLLDSETGAVVCGFDELFNDLNQSSSDKKEEKVMNKFLKGGAYAKYGLKKAESSQETDSDIEIGKLSNLPTFFIAINRDDLVDILENLDSDKSNPAEIRILKDLITSLNMQINKMKESDPSLLNHKLVSNLKNSEDLIKILEEKILN